MCAHLGLKPQSVHKLAGSSVQGRDQQAADHMLEQARASRARAPITLLLDGADRARPPQIRDAVQITP